MRNVTFLILMCFLSFFTPAYAVYDNLYLVGNATEAGWNPDAAIPMERSEAGVFSWTGTLTDYSVDQARFKFLVANRWEPSITCRCDVLGHLLVEPGVEYDLYERPTANDGYDNAFQVAVTGVYTLEVNLNTMKMVCTKQDETERENWEYVRPEIGADGEGHVFPGVCTPFGLVKLGPDCGDMNANAGWSSGGNIHGFSHLHVSGTGGGPKYGNILFQPMTGDLNLADYSSARTGERFGLDLYEVTLSKYNIGVRLTALDRAGFHEYTFPQSASSKVLIDAGSCLTLNVESQELMASGVKILSDHEIEGYSTVRGGWNLGDPYTVYFYAIFDTPADAYAVWRGTSVLTGNEVDATGTEKSGAYFEFNTTESQKIRAKVGISFISTAQARENVSGLSSWSFDEVRQAGIDRWNEVLNTVDVEGTDNDKTIFYSALYHACLQPSDRTGENPLWQSDEPYYDDYYAIWDTFRATHPLFTLLTPSRQADMVRSMIDIYEHEGYMPDGRSGNCNGRVQGGSNSDILIADAMVKNLPGIDYEKGLAAMIKNAEVEPADPRKEGRGGVEEYNSKGYLSTATERSGSRTYEYSYCDYAIATVAGKLGQQEVYEKYLERSNNWKNLWNDNINSLGFKGFLWPKNSNGDWVNERDYNVFRRDGWEGIVYESFPWEMSFYVPHDVNGLIARCGGKETFLRRLDTYFTHVENGFDQGSYMGLFQISNEPAFLVPSLYNYVNRPDKAAEIVRKVLKNRYNISATGLPGNDDSGSMSAWYIFHAMGFFPNAGQDVYLISSPVFAHTTIRLENGNTFEIVATGASDKNIYIQSARLNGEPLDRCWLRHDEIVAGGTLEFVMGEEPSTWAFDGETPPSSPVGIDEVSPEIESPQVRIQSYSAQVGENEAAYCLFEEPEKYVKWCDNKSTEPWVIFELADVYEVDRFVFRDSKTVEGNNNVHSYRIYTSLTGVDGDWEEVVNRNDEAAGNANVKDHRLAEPKAARYVKFSMELPTGENAVRIYGFDIYGHLKERVDRGALVSVGKTFLKSSGSRSFYANARHLFDGVTADTEYHWTFDKSAADRHYCIVDLEDVYKVNTFKVYDSGQIDGYNVYVATECPDLDKDNATDGNEGWTLVTSGLNKNCKSVTIEPVEARYVKLEIPSEHVEGESASVTEFEVYRSDTPTGIEATGNEDFAVYPNPVKRGESLHLMAQGLVSIYTIDGKPVWSSWVDEAATLSTDDFLPGIYLGQVNGLERNESFKLIVE